MQIIEAEQEKIKVHICTLQSLYELCKICALINICVLIYSL